MKNQHGIKKQPLKKNVFWQKIVLLALFLMFLSGALAIPFYFETMTLWYKVGTDKTLLRGGQVAGMFVLVLLFSQIVFAVRGQFLEKLFGIAAMARFHRINGLVILAMAMSHVFLVLAPEGLNNLPIGKKFWPEMVGALLLIIISSMVISSYFQQRLTLNYSIWRPVHKTLGYLSLILLPIHVLFVSDSFEQTPLRAILIMLTIILFLWVIIEKIMVRFQR